MKQKIMMLYSIFVIVGSALLTIQYTFMYGISLTLPPFLIGFVIGFVVRAL